MLPIVNNVVRPWFEQYGATLDDRTTWRHMISQAEKDVAGLKELMPEYRAKAPDVVPGCEAELAEADKLIIQMRGRLAEIEAPFAH